MLSVDRTAHRLIGVLLEHGVNTPDEIETLSELEWQIVASLAGVPFPSTAMRTVAWAHMKQLAA